MRLLLWGHGDVDGRKVIEPCFVILKWEMPISKVVGGACCYGYHVSLAMMLVRMMKWRKWEESALTAD